MNESRGEQMRVLIVGSGGREHALAWGIAKSPKLEKLFVAPGNAGTEALATNVALDIADHQAVVDFARRERIDFVVIGPDAPAVAGLGDDLRAAGLLCFGPSKAAAQLEGSKSFTKALCDEMGIPTAAYRRSTSADEAIAYVRGRGAPIVVKADGLAAGKGVVVAETIEAAEAFIRDCFGGAFGASGASVVIEEFLDGEEVSLFALCDGKNFVVLLESAQDHKRAFDGDAGPNTGGMGAYSPAPVLTPELLEQARREIIEPTVRGMAARGMPFTGVLYAGLMITRDGPKLIEYNVRFGDPEAQVLIPRLESDLLDLLEATARGKLAGVVPRWRPEPCVTVVMATAGYPGSFERGSEIRGVENLDAPDLIVFHAGTQSEGERLVANGGRVLDVTALGPTIAEARDRAYAAVEAIDWPQGFYRHDIGWRAVGRPHS